MAEAPLVKRPTGIAGALRRLSLGLLLIAVDPTFAQSQAKSAGELDEHVHRLASELRCLVCQNQTIADSQAELAIQLKREVRQQLAHGATDEEVREFMVRRYGDFVLYNPPLRAVTWLLWGGPALLLLLGLTLFGLHWRERQRTGNEAPDSVLPQEEPLV